MPLNRYKIYSIKEVTKIVYPFFVIKTCLFKTNIYIMHVYKALCTNFKPVKNLQGNHGAGRI